MNQPVASPCTDVCRMHPSGRWCEGCHRTLEEIAAWSTMDDSAKRALWLELERRRLEPKGGSDGAPALKGAGE